MNNLSWFIRINLTTWLILFCHSIRREKKKNPNERMNVTDIKSLRFFMGVIFFLRPIWCIGIELHFECLCWIQWYLEAFDLNRNFSTSLTESEKDRHCQTNKQKRCFKGQCLNIEYTLPFLSLYDAPMRIYICYVYKSIESPISSDVWHIYLLWYKRTTTTQSQNKKPHTNIDTFLSVWNFAAWITPGHIKSHQNSFKLSLFSWII